MSERKSDVVLHDKKQSVICLCFCKRNLKMNLGISAEILLGPVAQYLVGSVG